MNIATLWLLVKALITVLPTIIAMVREGQIREATAAEIETAFAERWTARFENAKKAEETPVDEATDPYNRTRT